MRWSSVKEMFEEALLSRHFEIGEEMRRRNMAGAKIWITVHGLVAAGNEDAKKWQLEIAFMKIILLCNFVGIYFFI